MVSYVRGPFEPPVLYIRNPGAQDRGTSPKLTPSPLPWTGAKLDTVNFRESPFHALR
jgi:hypothetical protein